MTDAPDISEVKYEYLEHPADIQLHAWGANLSEALENLIIAMYGYMAEEIDRVERIYSMDFEASGSDDQTFVYNTLDELLYNFNAEPFFIGRVVRVQTIDEEKHSVKLRAWGDSFSLKKHGAGTEIKAITYSNMQINRGDDGSCDIYVVVDI